MIKIYKVGGSVRDIFLNIKSKDIDYAVEANSYEDMKKYVYEKCDQIFLEKPEYFCIRGKYNNQVVDFTLCRKDGYYSDNRHPDNVQIGNIYDDLSRRDFTINAIAIDENNNIIDPYNGINHLINKQLKCVGDAETRFNEDALRMLRAIRFCITKNLIEDVNIIDCLNNDDLIKKLQYISEERIREELFKCFNYSTIKTLDMLDCYSKLRNYIFTITDIWLEPTLKLR